MSKRLEMRREVVNLTPNTIKAYDEMGNLVDYKPEKDRIEIIDKLQSGEHHTTAACIVDDNIRKIITTKIRQHGKNLDLPLFVTAEYQGKSGDGEDIYSFIRCSGVRTRIIPIFVERNIKPKFIRIPDDAEGEYPDFDDDYDTWL